MAEIKLAVSGAEDPDRGAAGQFDIANLTVDGLFVGKRPGPHLAQRLPFEDRLRFPGRARGDVHNSLLPLSPRATAGPAGTPPGAPGTPPSPPPAPAPRPAPPAAPPPPTPP